MKNNEMTYPLEETRDAGGKTEKHIKYYLDLCSQKNAIIEDYEHWTPKQMSARISELQKINTIHPNQVKEIKRVAGILGINVSDEFISQLKGGKDNTASQYVQWLHKQLAKHNKTPEARRANPMTDNQVKFIADMMWCEDVDLNVLGIDIRFPLEDGLWRSKTVEEVTAELRELNLNVEQASNFIQDNSAKYYAWRNRRISDSQIDFIKTLEERMASLYVPRLIFDVDEDGNAVMTAPEQKDISGFEYTDEAALRLLSRDDAKKYIDHLQVELKDKSLTRGFSDGDQMLGKYLENNSKGDDPNNPHSDIQSTIYEVCAVIGEEPSDEVMMCVTSYNFYQANSALQEILEDFFEYNVESGFISEEGLEEIIERNESLIASSALEALQKKWYAEA